MKSQIALLCAASALALSGFSAAAAQTSGTPPGPPLASAAPSNTITEVVVTAQRREETVQKSSVPIEVLTAQAIRNAGVTQAQDLTAVVPGVQISQGGAATQIYIRGVGDFGSTAITNPAVAFNLDGVYVARPAAVEGNFFDLQRVEVLKGPQGTLYGRNASGGAINVITQKPVIGKFEALGNLEVGDYSEVNADAAINIPVNDTLALRAAFQVVHRDGYVTDNFNDDKHESFRATALWKPNERLSILFGGDYIHVGGGGPAYVPLNAIPGVNSAFTSTTNVAVTNYYNQQAAAAGLCAPRTPFIPASPGNLSTFSGACPNLALPFGSVPQTQLVQPPAGAQGSLDNQFYSIHAEIAYDLGFATLTLLPAYRNSSVDYKAYPIGYVADIAFGGQPETSEATSVEARLSHDSAILKWVGGFFFFNEDQRTSLNVNSGLVQNSAIEQTFNTRSYALFGQATLAVREGLRLIGGLRYTDDQKSTDGVLYYISPGLNYAAARAGGCVPTLVVASITGCQGETFAGDKDFGRFNWKAGVEYDLSPHNMLYFTASTGFKSGGFYSSVGRDIGSTQAGSYNPETLTAYELGSRNRFFENRLQVNLEAFYWEYDKHQEPAIILDGQGNLSQSYLNAGSATSKGVDIDVIYKLSALDTLHIGGEYLDSRYDSFVYNSPIIPGSPLLVPPGATGCRVTNSATQQTVDCSGFPLTRAPKYSGAASYDHLFELSNGGTLDAQGSVQFATSRWLAIDFLPIEHVGGYATLDANLTYTEPHKQWTVGLYGRNLTDEVIYTGANRSSFLPALVGASIQPPRTYGARFGFHF